jgi:hypothetical protein
VLAECLNITVDIVGDINGDMCAQRALDETHRDGSEGLHTLPGSGISWSEANVGF